MDNQTIGSIKSLRETVLEKGTTEEFGQWVLDGGMETFTKKMRSIVGATRKETSIPTEDWDENLDEPLTGKALELYSALVLWCQEQGLIEE